MNDIHQEPPASELDGETIRQLSEATEGDGTDTGSNPCHSSLNCESGSSGGHGSKDGVITLPRRKAPISSDMTKHGYSSSRNDPSCLVSSCTVSETITITHPGSAIKTRLALDVKLTLPQSDIHHGHSIDEFDIITAVSTLPAVLAALRGDRSAKTRIPWRVVGVGANRTGGNRVQAGKLCHMKGHARKHIG